MCLACVKYLQGEMKLNEFLRNREEFITEKHDPKADAKATKAINAIIFGNIGDELNDLPSEAYTPVDGED